MIALLMLALHVNKVALIYFHNGSAALATNALSKSVPLFSGPID